jgi:hypothetical protein
VCVTTVEGVKIRYEEIVVSICVSLQSPSLIFYRKFRFLFYLCVLIPFFLVLLSIILLFVSPVFSFLSLRIGFFVFARPLCCLGYSHRSIFIISSLLISFLFFSSLI